MTAIYFFVGFSFSRLACFHLREQFVYKLIVSEVALVIAFIMGLVQRALELPMFAELRLMGFRQLIYQVGIAFFVFVV